MLFLLALIPALAQSPAKLSFEVASVRPAPDIMTLAQQIRSGKGHIGTKIDGHRVDIGFSSLRDLICMAYKVQPHQVTGPDWLVSQRFEINATIPEGVSQDKVPEMMQSLLAERFGLKIHRETRDHPIYALVVGKGGIRMKEAPPEENPPSPPEGDSKVGTMFDLGAGPQNMKQDGKGGMVMSGSPLGNIRIQPGDGVVHMEMSKVPMATLAQQMTQLLDHPVFDMTDLKGNYEVALDIPAAVLLNMVRSAGIPLPVMPPGAGGADAASDPGAMNGIFASVQKLGLKLEPRRQPFEDVVVDHIEKTPTEN